MEAKHPLALLRSLSFLSRVPPVPFQLYKFRPFLLPFTVARHTQLFVVSGGERSGAERFGMKRGIWVKAKGCAHSPPGISTLSLNPNVKERKIGSPMRIGG